MRRFTLSPKEPISISAPELNRLWRYTLFCSKSMIRSISGWIGKMSNSRWIAPEEIKHYLTVPKLEEALQAVLKIS